VEPSAAAAIEDSTNGLLAARAAGLGVIAMPNRAFPPAKSALEAADSILGSLDDLTPEVVEASVRKASRRPAV
jgi:beta-phosphoglucomutase-like phosphatase (HAD superfamily)